MSNTPQNSQPNNQLVERLETLIAIMSAPKVPPHKALWDSADCASYLRVTKDKFLRTISCIKTFPTARNVDKSTTNATNKRWLAGEVMAWAEAQRVH